MLQFLNEFIRSGRGSGAARECVAVSARILLLAVILCHIVFASPVHESKEEYVLPVKEQSNFVIQDEISLGILPNFALEFTTEGILHRFRTAIANRKAIRDHIGSVPLKECTYKRIMGLWALNDVYFEKISLPQMFYPSLGIDKAVHDSIIEAGCCLQHDDHVEKSITETWLQAIHAVAKRPARELARLTKEERRFLDKTLLDFEYSGYFIGDKKRVGSRTKRRRINDTHTILNEKHDQINELCEEFCNTLHEDDTELLFSAEELDGATDDFLASLERVKETGKYRVTMNASDVVSVLRNVRSEAVRELLAIAYNGRCETNLCLLAELVKLRHECAQLLGYPDHATFRIKDTMAKNPERVLSFLRDLQAKLTPLVIAELAKLTELKAQEMGLPVSQVQIHSWDVRYYMCRLLERDFALDLELVGEYFSLDHVTKEMLCICEETFGLRFRQVPDAHARKLVWHGDVTLWEVWNAEGYVQPGTVTAHDDAFVGHLYLDLLSRPGKSTGDSCCNVQPGCQLSEDGTRQFPAVAIVTNSARPTATRPSLMRHYEVVDLFHEMGHAMHELCVHVQFSYFRSTNVESDFIEMPSQMFEKWCWDEKMLSRLSRHYLRKDEPLPHDLRVALVNTKNLNAGLRELSKIFFAMFDLTIHTGSEYHSAEAISALYERLHREICLIPLPQDVCPAAIFDHIASGYDATYYGYLWGEVLAADMFYSRFADVLDNPAEVGRMYRNSILRPGGSRDGMESLVEFIGREPSTEPFLRSLGLE